MMLVVVVAMMIVKTMTTTTRLMIMVLITMMMLVMTARLTFSIEIKYVKKDEMRVEEKNCVKVYTTKA